MARLASFLLSLLSQNIAASDGGIVQQLTGPLLVLRPKFIPSQYSFAVTIGINDIDLTQENILRIVLRTPTGSDLVDTGNITINPTPQDIQLPEEWQGFVATLPIQNTEFAVEGVYQLIVFCNDELLGTQSIPVYQKGDAK